MVLKYATGNSTKVAGAKKFLEPFGITVEQVNIDIPAPSPDDNLPCGRAEMNERLPMERGSDFEECEIGLSLEEAIQEAGRCLRCDYHGFGSFRGGRSTKW